MLGRLEVVEDDEGPVAESGDLVSRLPRITPYLELIVMAADLVEGLFLVESELLFPVVPAVVVVEEQVVVR